LVKKPERHEVGNSQPTSGSHLQGSKGVRNLNNQTSDSISRKKKTRRGRKIKNELNKLEIYYQNVRGLKSKQKSLATMTKEKHPTIIALNETHLSKEENINIDEYEEKRNDRNSDGRGVLTAYKKELKNVIMEVEKVEKVIKGTKEYGST